MKGRTNERYTPSLVSGTRITVAQGRGEYIRLHKLRGGRICRFIIKAFVFIANAKPPSLSSPSFLLMGILPTAERCSCPRGPDPSYPSLDFERNAYKSTPVMVSTPATQRKGRYFVSSILLGHLARVAMRRQKARRKVTFRVTGIVHQNMDPGRRYGEHIRNKKGDHRSDACSNLMTRRERPRRTSSPAFLGQRAFRCCPNKGAGCNCHWLRIVCAISESS